MNKKYLIGIFLRGGGFESILEKFGKKWSIARQI